MARWRFVYGSFIENGHVLVTGVENQKSLMLALGRAQRRIRRISAGKLTICFMTNDVLLGHCVWYEELVP